MRGLSDYPSAFLSNSFPTPSRVVKGNLLQNEWNQIHCLFVWSYKQTEFPVNTSNKTCFDFSHVCVEWTPDINGNDIAASGNGASQLIYFRYGQHRTFRNCAPLAPFSCHHTSLDHIFLGQSSLLRSSLDLFSFSLNTALPFSPSPAPQVRQRWYNMIEFNGKEFDGRRTHHLMAVSTLGGDILMALPILVAETNQEVGDECSAKSQFFPQLEGSISQNGAKMVPKSFRNGLFPLQCLAGYYHIDDGHLLDTKNK